MFSLKLGLFLCIFYIIDMEAAPEPEPEDLHIHLNLHDTTGTAQDDTAYYDNNVVGNEVDAGTVEIKGLIH